MIRHPLPLRPQPYDDETPGGFLIRAAELNHHITVFQLLSGTGVKLSEPALRACLLDEKRFGNILRKLGIFNESFNVIMPKRMSPSGRSPRIYKGVSIAVDAFRFFDATTFCSLCLIKENYWRNAWTIRPFGACMIHQRLLLDHCHACGSPLRQGRGKLLRCFDCNASLETMRTNWVKTDSQSVLHDMIQKGQQKAVDDVLSLWRAFAMFDGKGDSPEVEHERLELVIQCYKKDPVATKIVAFEVEQRTPLVHPRIQLMPFLIGSDLAAAFAHQVLQKLLPTTTIGTGDLRQPNLSKHEVCKILDITHFEITNFINEGILIWPPGREQRISTSAIERFLHRQYLASLDGIQLLPTRRKPILDNRQRPHERGQAIRKVESSEAADQLGVMEADIAYLVRRRILSRIGSGVGRSSLLKLLRTLRSTDYMTLEEACAYLDRTIHGFKVGWISCGIVTLYDFGLWKLVLRKEISIVAKRQIEFMTVSEAEHQYGLRPEYLKLLDSGGTMVVFKLGRRLHQLYKREAVFQLRVSLSR